MVQYSVLESTVLECTPPGVGGPRNLLKVAIRDRQSIIMASCYCYDFFRSFPLLFRKEVTLRYRQGPANHKHYASKRWGSFSH